MLLWIVLLTLSLGSIARASPCKLSFTPDDDQLHCITVVNKYLTWTEARAECQSLAGYGVDGDLITINTQKEQDFARRLADASVVKGFWVGLSNDNIKSQYEWVADMTAPYFYENWGAQEPSRSRSPRCVADLGPSGWFAIDCNTAQPFMCSYPIEPRLSTTDIPEKYRDQLDLIGSGTNDHNDTVDDDNQAIVGPSKPDNNNTADEDDQASAFTPDAIIPFDDIGSGKRDNNNITDEDSQATIGSSKHDNKNITDEDNQATTNLTSVESTFSATTKTTGVPDAFIQTAASDAERESIWPRAEFSNDSTTTNTTVIPDTTNHPTTAQYGDTCPQGKEWTPFGLVDGKPYCVLVNHSKALSWYDARTECQKDQADLLVVPNPEVHRSVKNLISPKDSAYVRFRFWFGLNVRENDGSLAWNQYDYQWTDLDSKSEGRWSNPLYDNVKKPHCGALIAWKNGRWNNVTCSEEHYYICMPNYVIKKLLDINDSDHVTHDTPWI